MRLILLLLLSRRDDAGGGKASEEKRTRRIKRSAICSSSARVVRSRSFLSFSREYFFRIKFPVYEHDKNVLGFRRNIETRLASVCVVRKQPKSSPTLARYTRVARNTQRERHTCADDDKDDKDDEQSKERDSI